MAATSYLLTAGSPAPVDGGEPMDVNDMLGIKPNDPLAERAKALQDADRQLLADLVARRHELGLKQAEVARRMDSDQSTVARIESGGRDLHQSTIRRYAMAVEALVEHRVVPADRSRAKAAERLARASAQARSAWPENWAAALTFSTAGNRHPEHSRG